MTKSLIASRREARSGSTEVRELVLLLLEGI